MMFSGHLFFPYMYLHIIFHKFSKFWFLVLITTQSVISKVYQKCYLSPGLCFSSQFAENFHKQHLILSSNYAVTQETQVLQMKKKKKRKKQVLQMMKPQCREDLSRNLLKVCWHLFACFPPCLMDHHNVTLVSFFFNKHIFFIMC